MPRAKKDYLCLNVKIDAEICHRLTEVSTEAGQTKTVIVERLAGIFCRLKLNIVLISEMHW